MPIRLLNPQPTPITEPVSVDTVKRRLRLTSTDDDDTVWSNITAAREYAEKITRRSLTPKSYIFSRDHFPYPFDAFTLPAPPLVAVAAVKYLDPAFTWQTWDASSYFVAARNEPAIIVPMPGMCYPDTARVPGAVEVGFIAGYGGDGVPACPGHLAEAIAQLAVHLYSHPETITADELREVPYALSAFFAANKVYTF